MDKIAVIVTAIAIHRKDFATHDLENAGIWHLYCEYVTPN
jgi:hypothetical protein